MKLIYVLNKIVSDELADNSIVEYNGTLYKYSRQYNTLTTDRNDNLLDDIYEQEQNSLSWLYKEVKLYKQMEG